VNDGGFFFGWESAVGLAEFDPARFMGNEVKAADF